ncbi:MAG: hypothetical protein NTV86_09555, partial [Planctomycetota bacterium]|nr:hypothetical protein [Planctomycetota bacterium]
GRAAAAVAALVVLGLWTSRHLPPGSTRVRATDFSIAYRLYYDPLVERAAAEGRWTQAADIMEDSLRCQLPLTARPNIERPLVGGEQEIVDLIRQRELRCAESCRRAGREDATLGHATRARQLAQWLGASQD